MARRWRWIVGATAVTSALFSTACQTTPAYLAAFATLPTVPLPAPPAESAPAPQPAPSKPLISSAKPAWGSLTSWGMQNAQFPPEMGLGPAQASTRQMLVLGRKDMLNRYWARPDVEATKVNKWVLAYVAAGEAQKTEWYWQPGWQVGNPSFLMAPNPYWDNNVFTNIGSPAWRTVLHQTVDKVLEQGFDGVFLDVVDAYWIPGNPIPHDQMAFTVAASLVCDVAAYGRARNPEFKVVVNNAMNLIADVPGYKDCIDGQVAEGLWYIDPGGSRRDDFYRNQKIGELQVQQSLGKQVFTIDYAPNWDEARVLAASRAQGYVPYNTPVGADGMLH